MRPEKLMKIPRSNRRFFGIDTQRLELYGFRKIYQGDYSRDL